MNDNTLKWVWLTTLKGMTPEKIYSLLEKFGDINEIYAKTADDYRNMKLIRESDIRGLSDKNTDVAEKVIRRTEDYGGYVITYDSDLYPKVLKKIFPPPYVLYEKGSLKLADDMFCISIVGTRYITEYGEAVTRKMSFELARAGFCVVSGLAKGIDLSAESLTFGDLAIILKKSTNIYLKIIKSKASKFHSLPSRKIL